MRRLRPAALTSKTQKQCSSMHFSQLTRRILFWPPTAIVEWPEISRTGLSDFILCKGDFLAIRWQRTWTRRFCESNASMRHQFWKVGCSSTMSICKRIETTWTQHLSSWPKDTRTDPNKPHYLTSIDLTAKRLHFKIKNGNISDWVAICTFESLNVLNIPTATPSFKIASLIRI